MRKLLLLLLISSTTSYANILDDFLAYQEIITTSRGLYEIDNLFSATTKDRTISLDSKVFLQKGAQASYIVQNGRPMIFLTTPIGSWVVQENVPNPLKVGGGYTVFGIMSIDDVLGIDFNNYKIVSNSNPMLLQSIDKSAAYNFIELKKNSNLQFESILMDRNQRPIKTGVYTLGTVNGVKTITSAKFQDLVLDTNRTSSFVVKSLKKSAIPPQILSPERIKLLFSQIK